MKDALALSTAPPGTVAADQCGRFRYQAFGLGIASTIALPELLPAGPEPIDLEIRRRPTAADFPPSTAATAYDWTPGRQELLWPAVGRFTILDNAAIEVEAAPGVEDRLLAFPLLGPVMALVKHLRGSLVLHGSGVGVNGSGVVFLGDKLAGKSTLASAFLAHGHELLSDDVISISGLELSRPLIEPAFPQVKLSPAAAQVLAATDSEAWPEVLPGFPKRQHRLALQTMSADIAPRMLFALTRGSKARIDRLDGGEIFGSLMHNCYVKKFIGRTLTPQAGSRHLGQLAALARFCTVARLQVPDSLERLSEAVDLVERALGECSGAPA